MRQVIATGDTITGWTTSATGATIVGIDSQVTSEFLSNSVSFHFTLSGGSAYSGTSSVLVMHLVRPLMTIPIMTSGVGAERDMVNQLPSLPRIIDGAHLKLLMYSTGSTSNNSPFMAALEFAWGGS